MNREIVIPGGAGVYPITGDVASQAGNAQVVVTGIQHIPVEDTFFEGQEYLKYDATTHQWIPTRIEGPGNQVFATPADGSTADAALRALVPADLPIATTSAVGAVEPDGTTITVDTSGIIKASQQIELQTNGTNNGSQVKLNLKAGTNITVTDDGTGDVTIAASSGTSITLQTNGTNNGSQTKLNLKAGTGMTLTDDGTGDVTIASSGGASFSLGGTLSSANIAVGPGAGTGGSATITGYDGSHQVTVITGSSPVASGVLFTVTFTASRGHNTYPVLFVVDNNTVSSFSQLANLQSADPYSYQIVAGTTAMAAGNTFVWNVVCP